MGTKELLEKRLEHLTVSPQLDKGEQARFEAESGSRTAAEWAECQRIVDLPEVDDLLRGFSEDPTNDGAVCLACAILAAASAQGNGSQAIVAPSAPLPTESEGGDCD